MIERLSPPGAPAPQRALLARCSGGRFHLPRRPGAAARRATSGKKHGSVLSNVKLILEGVGASLADVVKVGVYLADGAEFAAMNEVYAEFFGESKPARTTIVCKFMADIRIEIDCIAFSPKRG